MAELSQEAAADLLDAALDFWAASGADLPAIGLPDKPTGGKARQESAKPKQKAGRFPGFEVVTLGLPEDPDGVPRYSVLLGRTSLPDGRPLPMLSLECETAGAGIEDLRARTHRPARGRTRPRCRPARTHPVALAGCHRSDRLLPSTAASRQGVRQRHPVDRQR
ncbi:hypothetical protein EDD94_7960 [Streptomyces sp. PanSC9]|nr:hypothetical protein EDD94_7960 [Streptomyces sp. PanSC9]